MPILPADDGDGDPTASIPPPATAGFDGISDASEPTPADGAGGDTDTPAAGRPRSMRASSDVVKPSDVDPLDLLTDKDSLGLVEYLQQPPRAMLPTVEATHKLVAGAVARLLDGRLLRYEKRWLAVRAGGQGWEELSDDEVCTIVRGIISRGDADSPLQRRIIPVGFRKVEPDDLETLVRFGIGQLRGDVISGQRVCFPDSEVEVKKVMVADDQWAERAGTAREIVSDLAGRSSVVLREDFDSNPYEIHCRGWIIDLSPQRASRPPRPATRRDLVMRSLNADFDPAAQCPQWKKFVSEVTAGNTELARFLQKAAGLSLLGEIREQVAFVLYGELGNNGKSQFTEVLLHVFGDYGTEIASTLIQERDYEPHPTEMMPLRGARFVVTAETSASGRWDVNKFKRLVTPGWISARLIAKDTAKWIASHTMWATTNHRPRIGTGEAAFFKRYLEIPFTQRWFYPHESKSLQAISVGQVDPGLAARLAAESSGIVNWLLEGLDLYWQEGLAPPAAVLDACRSAKGEANLWMEFLDEAVKETGDSEGSILLAHLWDAWKTYRQANSERSSEPPRNVKELQRFVKSEFPGMMYRKSSPNGKTKAAFLGLELTAIGRDLAGLETQKTDGKPPATVAHTPRSNVTPLFAPTPQEAGA